MWPYPKIVAHRGGGALAPENTLGAIRTGAALGFKAVEFDVMLAADGVPVLIHDETTERTTGVKGRVAQMRAAQLEGLDAGNGEGVPRFEKAAELCRKLGVWANVEIKPAAGHERRTGEAVARMAMELWRGSELPPVLSSFSLAALLAAQEAAPALPRGYLVDEVPPDWESKLKRLGCVSLHCNHKKLEAERIAPIRAAGYAIACYTVNDPAWARRLLDLGVDCIITDALREIGPAFSP
ncbi:MAG TPA: glycerophosphodiester phosphodiesterase [Burkholderiales bacterium]|nr:glycerophosphodiester phosphodiesterase [Burkholderiales bacterium]